MTSYSNDKFIEPLRFCIFLILDIPAIICSLFALYHLLKERKLRETLHNHVTIIILCFNLIYQLIDIPLHLQYFRTGFVRPIGSIFCLIWWFIDYGFFFLDLILLMWASFERHILIFHKSMVSTQRKRLLIHYLPLFTIIMFMIIFYSVVIFVPPCENTFDFTKDLCGTAGCYHSITFFAMMERIGFAIIPTFLIVIFSITLFIRVIWQKYRVQRNVEWRKQRKLTLHLILVSLTYLCFDLPLSIIDLVHLCGYPNWANNVLPILFYLSYFPILLLPIVCLGSIPELRNKLKRFYLRRRQQQQQRIAPTIIFT